MTYPWRFRTLTLAACLLLSYALRSQAHVAPFVKGMFCEHSKGQGLPYHPLTNLTMKDWWMHAYDGCRDQPPDEGVFLTLPAGGNFSVEMAENKACTTMSDNPDTMLGNFGNCRNYSASTYGNFANGSCIFQPNLHARSQSDAAGSAFAISYTSDISLVTQENLVVFSVAPNTPFERMATFSVPAALPACPPGGCICAWGWVPNGCGTLNFYMVPYRCTVTGAHSTIPVAAPQPPVYCHDDPSKCVVGSKQMIYVYQQDGNNIDVPSTAVEQLAPGYSIKNGFMPGAQNDIFVRDMTTHDRQSEKRVGRRLHHPLRFARDLALGVVSDDLSPLNHTPSLIVNPVEAGTPVYPIATPPPPASKPDKLVVAHFIVGNTYPYTKDDWIKDIKLASSKGINAFALNYGSDPWQPARIADAYQAALDAATGFKLFLSPDVTSLPCHSGDDARALRDTLQMYAPHAAQLVYRGRPLVSTFSGESCDFGTGSVNDGWTSVVRQGAYPLYFVPAFFVKPEDLNRYPVLDGLFGWDGSWPKEDRRPSWDYDHSRTSALGQDKIYIGAASPWFFTHYPSKNWFYGGDEWLYNTRWEQLVAHRDEVDIVEVISWNDFGESHYVGPIEGAQPNSQAWVDGFDHTPWLDMALSYTAAFKSGAWQAIARDELYIWSRPHPHDADVSGDGLGRPLGWNWTSDYLWATVYSTASGSVSITSGDKTSVFSVYAGITKLQMPIRPGTIRGTLSRQGQLLVDVSPDETAFSFGTPKHGFNYNAFVATAAG